MSSFCRLLVAWVTVRPNALFPRLPSDCPQARGESSAHEAVSMLHSQKAIIQLSKQVALPRLKLFLSLSDVFFLLLLMSTFFFSVASPGVGAYTQ